MYIKLNTNKPISSDINIGDEITYITRCFKELYALVNFWLQLLLSKTDNSSDERETRYIKLV